jgi:hypothetical protein
MIGFPSVPPVAKSLLTPANHGSVNVFAIYAMDGLAPQIITQPIISFV